MNSSEAAWITRV